MTKSNKNSISINSSTNPDREAERAEFHADLAGRWDRWGQILQVDHLTGEAFPHSANHFRRIDVVDLSRPFHVSVEQIVGGVAIPGANTESQPNRESVDT